MVKAEFKLKKAKRTRKFVKDKAIVNFLLEHMKPAKINFSKIRIPSFINFAENEEKYSINSIIFQEPKVSDEKVFSRMPLNNTFLGNKKN